MRTVVVIGGGILGLATARELTLRGLHVTVLEKEGRWAAHQSGRNSNVVHAGLYYTPGSAKARLSVAGNRSVIDYARRHGAPVEVCGKLVVATDETELPALGVLAERAAANGVPARTLDPAQAREYEPEVSCVQALRVDSTAIIDYAAVCEAMVDELGEAGADLRLNSSAGSIRPRPGGGIEVGTEAKLVAADGLVNCAGLQSDRIARQAGLSPRATIVPFRGEYFALRPERAHLVRGLIYPVPDPTLPFLGVHLTRMLDGSVHAGPNAVLALSREGYRWGDISWSQVAEAVRLPGLWRLAKRYAVPTGLDEVRRSLSKRRFAASLARMVPAVGPDDLVRIDAGVRAQAILPDGSLVDDFLIEQTRDQIHVLNAPSPAATSALEIAKQVSDTLTDRA